MSKKVITVNVSEHAQQVFRNMLWILAGMIIVASFIATVVCLKDPASVARFVDTIGYLSLPMAIGRILLLCALAMAWLIMIGVVALVATGVVILAIMALCEVYRLCGAIKKRFPIKVHIHFQ